MKPPLPRTCRLCGQVVFGALGMTTHRRRRHGLNHGSAALDAELSTAPPNPPAHIRRYRAKWKEEQAKIRRVRPDIHERFLAILERVR